MPRTFTRSSSTLKRGRPWAHLQMFWTVRTWRSERLFSCQAVDLREILQPCGDGHRHPGWPLQGQRGHPHEAGGESLTGSGPGPGPVPVFIVERVRPQVHMCGNCSSPQTGCCWKRLKSTGTAEFVFKKKTSSHLAGVFKESKLRKIYPQRSAGGPDAASVEVSPFPPGKCLFFSQYSEHFTI